MNRREFISTLAAGSVPFINEDWKYQISATTTPPSSREQTYLRDFLVPEAALDDAYIADEVDELGVGDTTGDPPAEPGLRQRTVTTHVDRPDEGFQSLPNETALPDDDHPQVLRYDVASKKFVIPIDTTDLELDSEAGLKTKAGKPTAVDATAAGPAELHQRWYNEWWGSDVEPLAEYASDWVDIHSNEREDPHRWTEYFVRQPVLYLDPELMNAADSRRPYYEETLIIATTDWGVISLQSSLLKFGEGNEMFETVRALAEELYQQAQDAPIPTLEREAR